jgi:hypothetical protein
VPRVIATRHWFDDKINDLRDFWELFIAIVIETFSESQLGFLQSEVVG